MLFFWGIIDILNALSLIVIPLGLSIPGLLVIILIFVLSFKVYLYFFPNIATFLDIACILLLLSAFFFPLSKIAFVFGSFLMIKGVRSVINK